MLKKKKVRWGWRLRRHARLGRQGDMHCRMPACMLPPAAAPPAACRRLCRSLLGCAQCHVQVATPLPALTCLLPASPASRPALPPPRAAGNLWQCGAVPDAQPGAEEAAA